LDRGNLCGGASSFKWRSSERPRISVGTSSLRKSARSETSCPPRRALTSPPVHLLRCRRWKNVQSRVTAICVETMMARFALCMHRLSGLRCESPSLTEPWWWFSYRLQTAQIGIRDVRLQVCTQRHHQAVHNLHNIHKLCADTQLSGVWFPWASLPHYAHKQSNLLA
jgi:hypothetical protein